MDAVGPGASGGQEKRVTLAKKLLPSATVQDRTGINLGVHAIAQSRRQVGLDDTRDDVHARALRGQYQMNAHGAGFLGDAGDAVFHLAARHHHQIRQFINDHDDEGQRLQHHWAVQPTRVRRAIT